MPSLRSTFWHLLALCILSSAVLNAVARPFPLDNVLLEARADSQASSAATNPGINHGPGGSSEYLYPLCSLRLMKHFTMPIGQPHYDTTKVDSILLPISKVIKNLDVKLWRCTGTFQQWRNPSEPVIKDEKAWLCVGIDCFGFDASEAPVMQKISDDLTKHLEQSTTIGTMTFKDLPSKSSVLKPFAFNNRYASRGTKLDNLKLFLEELEEVHAKSTGEKFFAGYNKFKSYYEKMKELGNSD
ncbi:hypothetical protein F5890DRAFT_666901 [Lentinula detonsa]|uniref:Uncharacterized protein n=1 Tax=Lentinula detonsa TaxID=2804962 RepID=A0AA38UN82_9AGAR|nr:hypothetical protein F5890DRAFT_666901 [Lentinula detonsa]